MHQLASNVLTFFLSPVHWILILMIGSFLVTDAKLKKTSRIIAVVIFFVFSNPLVMGWYAKKWQGSRGIIDHSKSYSCGIVLGGFASRDADNYAYFNGAADRFIQTLKLYKVGIIQRILISGGNGRSKNDFREAAWVKNELITLGVPDSVIYIEDRSNNTYDNAIHAKGILDSLQVKPPYLLITSAYHIPRATLLFKKAGITTEPFACNYVTPNKTVSLSAILPQLGTLGTWEAYLKEAAGYLWYK